MAERALSFERACAQFVHRYTMEHVPSWALKPANSGKYYAPQFRTDREWYKNTKFREEVPGAEILRSSALDRLACYTAGQTWPLGHWLDAPYQPQRN